MDYKKYEFNLKDLKKGKCNCCSEMSNEILKETGRCVECEATGKIADDLINSLNL